MEGIMDNTGNNHENGQDHHLERPVTGTVVDAAGAERGVEIVPDAYNHRIEKEEILKKSGVDVVFPQFCRFPLEVRQLVWKIACLVPTVHIVGDYYRPKNRCPMNVLINVCKEARALVLSLQPSYFINNTVVEGFTYGDRTTSMLRNYFTPALDTIWLVRQDKERLVEDLSFYTSWFCGTCEVLQPSTSHGKDIEGNDCLRKSEDIRRLAINIKAWNNPDNFHGWGDMGSAGIISQHCVEEVLLVVETFGDFHWEDIVHFVEPSVLHRIAILKKNRLWDLPYLGKAYGDGVEVSRSRAVGETRNWEEDAMRMSAALEYHKHSFMDEGTVSALEFSFSSSSVDLSNWKVPKFRFVEARKGSEETRYA